MGDVPGALAREGLLLLASTAGPVNGALLVIGLCVGVFQAATQLTDQTLSFVPKLFAAIFAGAALLPWMASRLTEFSRLLIESIPHGG